ncbi:MAG: putative Ig domain-containing protein, partial [Vicinamibacterales bacterium]
RTLTPDQLVIQRAIDLTSANAAIDTDTAVFSDVLSNYTVEDTGDGWTTVTHLAGLGADGTDRVHNVERLQFADQTIIIDESAPINSLPGGSLTLLSTEPNGSFLPGFAINVVEAITDPDNVTGPNPAGNVNGPFIYTWQVLIGANWVPLEVGPLETPVVGPTFTPGPEEAGLIFRVVASFTDAAGVPEVFTSGPSFPVGFINTPPAVANGIDDQATDEDALFEFSVPNNAFADADAGVGDVLFYSSNEALDWLTFNPLTGEFSGTPDDSDIGTTSITVTATDLFGAQVSDTFDLTVANINDAPTGAVTISGTATEDQTLTVSNTLADDDGLGAITYQWMRNGVAIGGETGTSYTLTDIDVNANITVVASYTDAQGTPEAVTSAAVGPVVNVNDAPTDITVSNTVLPEHVAGVLATLTGADVDPGEILTYSLLTADPRFTLNALTGELSVSDQVTLDFERGIALAEGPINLTVRVTDSANVSYDEAFTFTVGDVNPDLATGTLLGDLVYGGSDADNINGSGGDDTIVGGGNNDIINGGTGNDTVLYTFGDGSDAVDGGDDTDTLIVTGTGGVNT